jgi:hypothetical protein
MPYRRFLIVVSVLAAAAVGCASANAAPSEQIAGPTCERPVRTNWLRTPPSSFRGEKLKLDLVLVVSHNVPKAVSLLARQTAVQVRDIDVLSWTGSPAPPHSAELHPYLIRAIDKGPSSALEVRTADNDLSVFTFSLGCAHNLKTPIIVFLHSKPRLVFVQAGGAL